MVKKDRSHQMRVIKSWENKRKEGTELELKYARDLPDDTPDFALKLLTEFEIDVSKFCFEGYSGLILDAGCATGNILMHALKLFPETNINYVGLDFSRNMLKKAVARAKKSNASFCQGSITDLPFKDNTFDRGICVGVVTYLASLDEVEESINEFYRILKPEGILIIDFFNRLSHCSILTQVSRKPFPDPPKNISPFWLRRKLKEAGFNIVSYRGYDFKPIQGRLFVTRGEFSHWWRVTEQFTRFIEKKIVPKIPFISLFGLRVYVKCKSKKIEKYIKTTAKPIALISKLGLNGLGVVRSLGRRGIPVIGIDPNPGEIGMYSRYCKGIVCPDPQTKEKEYIAFLLNLGEQLKNKGILIPTSDVDVLAISKHRDKLERYYEFPMAKLKVIEKLVNKRKFYEMLENLDVPHPKTYFPKDISEVKQISKEVTYPCIVKPIFSTNFGREFGVKVFNVNSEEELIKTYNRAKSGGHEVVIQEVIPGSDTNIYGFGSYANYKSELIGVFMYKKIRGYPKGFGTCSFVKSVWEPELFKLSTQLIKNINYHGISEVEFKKDLRDDKFKIIEVNARTWNENGLAARCGVNLPYMAYMDAIGRDVEKVISKKEGIKWLYMLDDLRSSFESISKRELTFIKYINSLRGKKEFAIFAWDDPFPFFVSTYNIGSDVLRFLLRRFRSYAKMGR